MKVKKSRWIESSLLLVVLGAPVAQVSAFGATSCLQGQQPEPAVACDESLEGTQGLWIQYGMHTTGCQISPSTETDKFRFIGNAGETVRLVAFAYSGCIDLKLELRDPVGAIIGTSSCDGGASPFTCQACSFVLSIALPLTGTYSATLSDVNADEVGSYALQLERIPPVYCAPDLPYNATIGDLLDPWTDQDFLTFEGVANTQVAVSVFANTGCIDPHVVILDPTGAVFTQGGCDGGASPFTCQACSFTIPAVGTVLPATGRYTLIIQDVGQDEIGNYQVSLACSFGACPLDPYARQLQWANRTSFQWTNNDVNTSFDVVKGDLGLLKSTGGNFTAANTDCLDPDDPTNSATDATVPAPGAGFFYLVRPVGGDSGTGSYDNCWGPGQVCSADPKVIAAPQTCPPQTN